MADFSAQIGTHIAKYKGRMDAVFKESVQDTVEVMTLPRAQGGRMRVDTGFLRASLMLTTTAMPEINRGARPMDGAVYGFNLNVGVIAGADVGDTIYAGFTASYAGYREHGANGQAPDMFVRAAAQQWQDIVDKNAARIEKT